MRAILVTHDHTLAWAEVPDPVRRNGEVLIRIRATALNRADLLQRQGKYPPPPGWPDWMGLEVAGDILEAPANSRFQVGDRVCALLGGGGYAERIAVPEGLVLPMPEGLRYEEATCIPEAFATSWLNLCVEGGMKAGDTVFIQAGASGLGMAAIQLAKRLGAKVVTTVGSDEKAHVVRTLGADVVINRKTQDIPTILAEYPVDVAMDCVAGPNLGRCLKSLAKGGRWIVIATLGGTTGELDMLDFFTRGVRLIGSTLRSRPEALKAQILASLEAHLWPAFVARELQVIIHQVLPITEAEAAHAILHDNANAGKVVLSIP